jgi:hypothetical protein
VSSALKPIPRISHKLLQRPSSTRYNIPATLRRHRTTFNHASVERLRRLVNAHPVLQRLRSSSPSTATSLCEPCHYGKQTKAPHSTDPVPASTAVMDKISGDTAGPMPTSSQGNRFFTFLVDRASNFARSIPTATKGDAGLHIVTTLCALQLASGKIFRRYHTDGAKELYLGSVQSYLQ